MNTCRGHAEGCLRTPTHRVHIFPTGQEADLCVVCEAALIAIGMDMREPEWVRRAKARQLPLKEYVA